MKTQLVAISIWIMTSGVVLGQQPAQQSDPVKQNETVQNQPGELPAPKVQLPAPQVVPQYNMLSPFLVERPPQLGQRNVWTMYAVDSTGQFRPRVAMTPGGNAYYVVNGRPFPWLTTNPQVYMPYAD